MMRLIILIFAGWGFAHVGFSQTPVTNAAYAPYLPASRSAAILPVLQRATDAYLSAPSLRFLSAESTWASEMPIINQVTFTPGAAMDVWLMRQKQHASDGDDSQRWSFVAIVVDHQTKPEISYYLEFAPEPVAVGVGTLPRPILPRVPCYRCHPSGPRVMRPVSSPIVPAWTAADKARLLSWNQVIAEGGAIETYFPQIKVKGQRIHLKDDDPDANAVVPFPFCHDCHRTGSGIRSELRRQHVRSMVFLLEHGAGPDGMMDMTGGKVPPAMPLGEDPLSKDQRLCLLAFLAHPDWQKDCPLSQASLPKAVDTTMGVMASRGSLLTSRSQLQVRAHSSIGPITLTDLALTGGWQRNPLNDLCQGHLSIDLQQARTGIALRDRHLHKNVLETARFPTATAQWTTSPCLSSLREGEQKTTHWDGIMTLKGVSRLFHTQVNCHVQDGVWRCPDIRIPMDMRDFGMKPPQFLGLKVTSTVAIEGELDFSGVDGSALR